jgi:hypothetical protein
MVVLQWHSGRTDRGRRNWKKNPEARDAVYRNRGRIRGRGSLWRKFRRETSSLARLVGMDSLFRHGGWTFKIQTVSIRVRH